VAQRRRDEPSDGRFAYDGLDRSFHEKARLGIVTALLTSPSGLLFGDLKRLCSLTDGNLSQHLEVLRAEGIVELWKGFQERRPHTMCRLTAGGRDRFLAYVGELEHVVRDARTKLARRLEPMPPVPKGWVKVQE
jgi:DNA-binding transcriptional ArsR family regulator